MNEMMGVLGQEKITNVYLIFFLYHIYTFLYLNFHEILLKLFIYSHLYKCINVINL